MAGSRAFWTLLDDHERTALEAVGHIRKYQSGETLIQAASTDRSLVVILDGSARVVADAGNGRVAVLAIRGRGEIVGELATLDGRPRYATVTAASPVRGLLLRHSAFSGVAKSHPRIMELLADVAIERLREADRRRVQYATTSVLSRTAAIIMEFAEKEPGVAGDPIHLDIVSQADLAGLAATSRESITRALADLRGRGIISTTRGRITILDIGLLRGLAAG
jgi:CRP/FNR family transcriptional regulator, cyclic AMP receptor protein